MKNTYMIIIVLVVLTVGGMGAYAPMNRPESAMTKSDSMKENETMVKDEKTMVVDSTPMVKIDATNREEDDAKMMQKKGIYTEFSPELLTQAVSTRRVLFFYANWCPICQPADESFSRNVAQLPADVTLIRVNYNDTETDQAEKDLAKKYGVTYQHTFVQIDAEGAVVTKWNGGQMNELLNNLK